MLHSTGPVHVGLARVWGTHMLPYNGCPVWPSDLSNPGCARLCVWRTRAVLGLAGQAQSILGFSIQVVFGRINSNSMCRFVWSLVHWRIVSVEFPVLVLSGYHLAPHS